MLCKCGKEFRAGLGFGVDFVWFFVGFPGPGDRSCTVVGVGIMSEDAFGTDGDSVDIGAEISQEYFW